MRTKPIKKNQGSCGKHKNALKTWWERILKKCGTTKHEGERKQKNEPLKNNI